MATNKAPNRNGKPLGLYFDESVTDKMRFIAWHNRESLTDVITASMTEAIAKFEKKNGAITDDQIKQALKKK